MYNLDHILGWNDWYRPYLPPKGWTFIGPMAILGGFRIFSLDLGYEKGDPRHLQPLLDIEEGFENFSVKSSGIRQHVSIDLFT